MGHSNDDLLKEVASLWRCPLTEVALYTYVHTVQYGT